MGSIRGIKSKAREEERATEARKRENQDRQGEEDFQTWQENPDPHYSEHCSDKPPCFGSEAPAMGDPFPQCHDCNIQGLCVKDFEDWSNHHVPDDANYEEELKDELWEQDYKDWIEEQSQKE